MKILGYEVHPASEIWPLMTAERQAALAESIRIEGLDDPIVLFEGQVLDGRCRLLACKTADIMPRFEDFTGDDPVAYVLRKHLHRRDHTDAQRKFAAASASKMYEAAALERMEEGRNQHSESPSADLRLGYDHGKATAKAAAEAGVSVRGVEQAKRVAAQPVLKQAVLDGIASLDSANTLADEPESKQKELVSAGPRAIKSAAKAKRESKKTKQKRKEVLREPGPSSNGMDFARMAIMDLEKIEIDDIERQQAFQHVMDWIKGQPQ